MIPALVDLIEFCDDEEVRLCVAAVSQNLRHGLEHYFDYILNPQSHNFQPIYAVATLLDRASGHCMDDPLRQAATKEIIRLLSKEDGNSVVSSQVQQSSRSEKEGSQMYGGFFKRKQQSSAVPFPIPDNSSCSIQNKIGQYLEEIAPFSAAPLMAPSSLEFWQQKRNTPFKLLAELALDVMAIPATSAGLERGFSHCGIATAGRRHRLTAQNLEDEIMVRLNRDFLD